MKRISLPILFTLTCLLFSCNNSRENEVALSLEEWIGKELIIPDDLIYIIKEDTVSYDIYSSNYKIFTFIDSSQCTSCSLKLQQWANIMEEFSILTEEGVNLIMILSPSNEADAHLALYRSGFKYPVSFDRERSVKRLNALSSDNLFHTFLLDADNRIVAVGNPATNPNVKKLYKNIIAEKVPTNFQSIPLISVSAASRQLGIVKPNKGINEKFYLSNIGLDSLCIIQIVPSCDCAVIKPSQYIIPPNEDIAVTMSFQTDSVDGRFYKTADIFFEKYINPIKIKTEGFVK